MTKPLFFPKRTPEQKQLLDERWQKEYAKIMGRAALIAIERGVEYNVVGSMPDYFEKTRDLLFMVRLKLQRLESGLAAGEKPLDSIIDAINYLAYLGAMLKMGWWE